MPNITLPDGSIKQLPDGATVLDLANSIGKRLAQAAVAGKVDGKVVDLSTPLTSDAKVSILTDRDPEALLVLRHSTAHVMAEAIQRLWPGVLLAYGPALETGFYYDMALDAPISSNDFPRIEAEMAKIVAEDRRFNRYDLAVDEGLKRLETEGNKYKIDNAQRAIAGGAKTLSWYVTGEKDKNWEDLCMGPHIPSTGRIKGFKIMSVASSNWHGDVKSDRFQRIYGTAFFDAKALDAHMQQLDEAKKRDHRVIGPALGLYAIDETVGQGLILWKPKGAIIRQELQNFISQHLNRQGYQQVFTPHIGKLDLYRTSGHFPYYEDAQFSPIQIIRDEAKPLIKYLRECRDGPKQLDAATEHALVEKAQIKASEYPWNESDLVKRFAIARQLSIGGMADCTCAEIAVRLAKGGEEGYLLKPMNCPMHIKIFSSEQRSYREMPVRLAEFGTVYRWEKSGELGGMTRVRGFTQDDAHLFVTEDQVAAEVLGCLELVKIILGTLGMHNYRVRVGMRDPDSAKYVGLPEQWDRAEHACVVAAESLGVPFSKEPGEAAFYGPKIDFVVKDVIGREWQLGTVQVDYQLPVRFDLSYIGADNQPHKPVMIHRAPFGSMERFIGVLIEHFAGAFPLWLSPVQVAVLSISEKTNPYAQEIAEKLKAAGLRVDANLGSEKIGAKIRTATMEKIPYMLVLGEKEQQANLVAVRHRTEGDKGQISVEAFIEKAKGEIASKALAGVEK